MRALDSPILPLDSTTIIPIRKNPGRAKKFSNDWKKCFQSLEKSAPGGLGLRFGGIRVYLAA